MPRPVRRIVTENDDNGRSRVRIDAIAQATHGGLTDLWITDTIPAGISGEEGIAARPVRLEPPPNGTLVRFFEIKPESAERHLTPAQREASRAEAFAAIGAAHARIDTSRHPAMHCTKTLDYIVLLSGQVTLLLDEGEVEMKPFDVVIQRGTNHGWVNHGTETAVLLAVLIDA